MTSRNPYWPMFSAAAGSRMMEVIKITVEAYKLYKELAETKK